MARLKQPITLLFSFVLSCSVIILTIWINLAIAKDYKHADGKTRALFGIIEMTYGFQYWLALPGVIALVLCLFTRDRSPFRLLCITLSIISIIFIFLRIWRIFV
jgi:hypothetical protein